MIVEFLQLGGNHTIFKASSGIEALAVLKEKHQEIQLVMSDLYMGDGAMSGLDLIGEIRRQGYNVDFLLMSSLMDDDVKARALALGAKHTINKYDIGVGLHSYLEKLGLIRHEETSSVPKP